MIHCRICGTRDQEIGESIICESCADKKENKNPKNCICDQYTTCEDCLNAVQNEGEKVLERLHIWYENYCEGNEDPDLWMAFLHAERTLWRAGEP